VPCGKYAGTLRVCERTAQRLGDARTVAVSAEASGDRCTRLVIERLVPGCHSGSAAQLWHGGSGEDGLTAHVETRRCEEACAGEGALQQWQQATSALERVRQ
jgi:hypothetical protein